MGNVFSLLTPRIVIVKSMSLWEHAVCMDEPIVQHCEFITEFKSVITGDSALFYSISISKN